MIYVDRVTLIGAPQHHKRDFPKVMKASLADLVRFWHKKHLKSHFRKGAAQKYKYRKRSAEYLQTKRRKYGHTQPLVATGLTRKQVGRFIFPKGTSKSVRGTMHAPWYVRMVPKTRKAPAMGKEITATAPDEYAGMAKRLETTVVEGLRNIKTREVIRL